MNKYKKSINLVNQIQKLGQITIQVGWQFLKLALKKDPKSTSKILSKIYKDDKKISNIAKKILKINK